MSVQPAEPLELELEQPRPEQLGEFTYPDRVPFSELAEDFMAVWGRADPQDPQPEHLEIFGPNGSGKTYLLCTCAQQRMIRRGTACCIICTKKADRVFARLGWPVISDPQELNEHPNAIFWPQTRKIGTARKAFYDARINDLLARLWRENANTIVAFDEVGYVEGLSGEAKANVQMYWREGRSLGITVIGMKQRPQGALRDMHSETYWTAAFPPNDDADLERWAELFGNRRDWQPVIRDLDHERREFLIRHSKSREAYISWVDIPLQPIEPPKRTPAWLGGQRTAA